MTHLATLVTSLEKQVADQKLNPANSALLGNIQVGVLGGRVAGWEGGASACCTLSAVECRGMPLPSALMLCMPAAGLTMVLVPHLVCSLASRCA